MGKNLKSIDLFKVYSRWRQSAEVFGCFVRSTNFVSLKHYTDFRLGKVPTERDASQEALEGIIKTYNLQTTLFMADLPGEKVLKTALLLNNDLGIRPVLTFNNPLHPFGLIGSRQYISRLLCYSGFLELEREACGYIFILDSNRYGKYGDEKLRAHFNNQYELTEENLPPLEMIQDYGFNKLMYLYQGRIKEDMKAYMEYLEEGGFTVVRQKVVY